MRELKFRAWSTLADPRMIYLKNGLLSDLKEIEDNWKVMQFTGLKDKNGKEIYFDDLYVSLMITKKLRVVTELTVAHWLIDIDKMNDPLRTVEIVGNKYQNPELASQ